MPDLRNRFFIFFLLFCSTTVFGCFAGSIQWMQVVIRYGESRVPLFDAAITESFYWDAWIPAGIFIFRLTKRLVSEPVSYRKLWVHLPLSLVIPQLVFGMFLGAELLYIFVRHSGLGIAFDLRQEIEQHVKYFYLAFPSVVLGCMTYLVITVASMAWILYSRFQAETVKRIALQSQLAQAELQALKMQLHPHFLFNTLNSISSLLYAQPDAAEKMIARLGSFLRLTLDSSHLESISLEEELEFLKSYLDIEQIRFQDRLSIEIDVETEALDASVPNLLLQPLIENAIRHGISQHIAAGSVSIHARKIGGQLELRVQNSGGVLQPDVKEGIGLSNTRLRLSQLYGTNFSLILSNFEGGVCVMIRIPFALFVAQAPTEKQTAFHA